MTNESMTHSSPNPLNKNTQFNSKIVNEKKKKTMGLKPSNSYQTRATSLRFPKRDCERKFSNFFQIPRAREEQKQSKHMVFDPQRLESLRRREFLAIALNPDEEMGWGREGRIREAEIGSYGLWEIWPWFLSSLGYVLQFSCSYMHDEELWRAFLKMSKYL